MSIVNKLSPFISMTQVRVEREIELKENEVEFNGQPFDCRQCPSKGKEIVCQKCDCQKEKTDVCQEYGFLENAPIKRVAVYDCDSCQILSGSTDDFLETDLVKECQTDPNMIKKRSFRSGKVLILLTVFTVLAILIYSVLLNGKITSALWPKLVIWLIVSFSLAYFAYKY